MNSGRGRCAQTAKKTAPKKKRAAKQKGARPGVGRVARAAAAIRQQRAAEAALHPLPVAVKVYAAPAAKRLRGAAVALVALKKK